MSEEDWTYDAHEDMWYEWTEESEDSQIQLTRQYGVDAEVNNDEKTPGNESVLRAEAPEFVPGMGVTAGDDYAAGWTVSERELREAEQSTAWSEPLLRESISERDLREWHSRSQHSTHNKKQSLI